MNKKKLHKNTPEKHNLNHFTSGFTHWHHSEMLTQTEHTALNLSLSLSTPSLHSVVISAHRRTRHSWTQNNVWSVRGTWPSWVYLWLWPPATFFLSCGWCLICSVQWNVVLLTTEWMRPKQIFDCATFIQIKKKKCIAVHLQKIVFWTFKYLVTQTSYQNLNNSINLKKKKKHKPNTSSPQPP